LVSGAQAQEQERQAGEGISPKTTAALLGCFAVAAFVARFLAFGHRGVIGFDETYYYILGRSLVTGEGYTLNGLPHTAFPPLYPLLVGLASFLTSTPQYALWIVSAVAGALLPLPVYFLGKDVHGKVAGLFAGASVAV